MHIYLVVAAWLLSLSVIQAGGSATPLAVTLSPDKSAYRLREEIAFTVTVKNTSQKPVPILVRGRDGREPLGILELFLSDPKQDKVRFDVCGLGCGTFLQNGFIEPGSEITMSVSIGANATWGPPASYQFIFRVAAAQAHRNEPYIFQASSNVAGVEINP